MRSSASQQQPKKKDFSVYDFGDEDLSVETASVKFFKTIAMFPQTKLRNSGSQQEEDPNIKYEFLRAFSSGQNTERTDVTGISNIDLCANASRQDCLTVDSGEGKLASADEKSELDENMALSSYEGCSNIFVSELDPETLVRIDNATAAASHVISSVGNEQDSELQSDGTPVDVNSDGDESCQSDSTSSPSSTSDRPDDEVSQPEFSEHQDSENCHPASEEKDDHVLAVTVSPDYVIYGNTLYGEAKLILSSDSIVVRCSETYGSNEDIKFEWPATALILIECQWSESVGAALVKFHLRAATLNGNEKLHNTCDVVQLIIAVADIRWLERELTCKSLAERYKGIWNVLHDDDSALEDYHVEHNSFFPRHYFTEIPDTFEDVIYPKGDPDAVSISKRDIELLQPDTYVNDTIIDFYIKYLKTKIPSNERDRFHFFNSFFFRKLADLDKDPESASEGRAAFLRVRKWTRKVNVFEKDYIFVPVNFNLHWSLLVICHPGEVTSLEEDNVKDSSKVPCILHMDSIKGSHNGLKNLVQSYLSEEWKERHSQSADDHAPKFLNMRFVSLELPQQENSFDCGLFLLHYVELFLDEAPANFNPFKIREYSNFLNVDWFVPWEASFKRSFIRKLVYDLLNDPSQNVAPTFCSDGNLSTTYNEYDIEQKPKSFNQRPALESAPGNLASVTDRGTKMGHGTPVVAKLEKHESLAKFRLIEPVATSAPSHELKDHSIPEDMPFCMLRYAEFPKEEPTCSKEPSISLNLGKEDFEMVDESQVTKPRSPSHSPKDVGDHVMPCSSMQDREEIGPNFSPEKLNIASNESDDTGKQGDCCYAADTPASSSGENEGGGAEDPQQIVSSKVEDGNYDDPGVAHEKGSCKMSPVIENMTEQNDANINCEQPSAALASIADGGDLIDAKGEDRAHHEANETIQARVEENEDHKETETSEGNANNDCHEIDACNTTEGKDSQENGAGVPLESEGLCLECHSQRSVPDEVITVDEPSPPARHRSARMKRGEPSAKMELPYRKRQKAYPIVAGRRLTRSLSKGFTP